MYTAAVLDEYSYTFLKALALDEICDLEKIGFAFKTPRGDSLPHHMTINLGAFDPKLNEPECLGQKAALEFDSIVFSEKLGVCACPITKASYFSPKAECFRPLRSANIHPHITICLKSGVPPKLSNQLLAELTPETRVIKLGEVCGLEGIIKTETV